LRLQELAAMSVRVISACAISAVSFATSAGAVSLTNRDDRDHKVSVIEGDAKQDHVVKSGGILEGICQNGCLIRLNDEQDDPYELEGPEVTWIEGGELLEELPEEASKPDVGEDGQPSRSGAKQ
jgi:hypothetical protein